MEYNQASGATVSEMKHQQRVRSLSVFHKANSMQVIPEVTCPGVGVTTFSVP